MENPFAAWLESWQTLADQSLHALANTPTAQIAATQFFTGQEQILRLMKMAFATWGAAQPTADAWQEQVEAFTAQLRSQMVATLEFWQSSPQLVALWQTYDQTWQQAAQPWLTFLAEAPTLWSKAATEETPAVVRDFAALLGNTFGAQWERILGAPGLGLAREFNGRQKKVYTHWLAYQQAFAEVQLMVGHAAIDAIAVFMQRLVTLAQAGKPLENERQWVDLWVEVADARFLELFHSAAYAQAQGKLVNSGMALRQAQRSVTETWLQLNDLPTRTDLDEAHRAIYELRREVKTLKKALEKEMPATAAEGAQGAPASGPGTTGTAAKPRPARRRTAATRSTSDNK
jgi:class III poly(R)-hydroxyalkanoic acid synthase PhaE subunit